MTSKLTTQAKIPHHSNQFRKPANPGFSATRLALQLLARVSPQKTGKLVNRMALRPSRLSLPVLYEHWLDNTDSYTQLQHGARTIPVYSWGEGPVILGVHGWGGAGIQFGAWIEPLVEAGYRVVLFDAPAHGRAQGESTDLFEMADVVAQVSASVGGIRGVLAHSLGSIAAARAITNGLQTDYLAMLAPPVSLKTAMVKLGASWALSPEVLAVHLGLMEDRFGPSIWDKLNLETLCHRLNQRGLIAIDDTDTSISPEESQRLATIWDKADLLRTSGLGHYRIISSPMVMETVLKSLGRA